MFLTNSNSVKRYNGYLNNALNKTYRMAEGPMYAASAKHHKQLVGVDA
jgi:hypothetical protein